MRALECLWDNLIVRLPTWVHLACAELELRAAPVDHLPDSLRAARDANLDRLARYRSAGEYPSSPAGVKRLSPCFRDGRGTLCAVAHLMSATGAAHLAGQLAARDNLAHVSELRTREYVDWVAETGFTEAELARIQPLYGPYLHQFEQYARMSAAVAGVGVAALWSMVRNVARLLWVRVTA